MLFGGDRCYSSLFMNELVAGTWMTIHPMLSCRIYCMSYSKEFSFPQLINALDYLLKARQGGAVNVGHSRANEIPPSSGELMKQSVRQSFDYLISISRLLDTCFVVPLSLGTTSVLRG